MGNTLGLCNEDNEDKNAEIFEDNASNRIRYFHPNRESFDPVAPPGESPADLFIDSVPKKATGELVKDGKYTKNANRRYVVLDGGFLHYYKGETTGTAMEGKTLLGTIDLKLFGLRNQHPTTPLNMVFVPIKDGAVDRKYDFEAYDVDCRKSWEKIIDAHAQYYRSRQ